MASASFQMQQITTMSLCGTVDECLDYRDFILAVGGCVDSFYEHPKDGWKVLGRTPRGPITHAIISDYAEETAERLLNVLPHS